MISSDTGPLHLARAVGAKTVGIYWAPNLINWGPLSRNNHKPVICWKMECPICGVVPVNPYPYEPTSETCNHNLSFVKEVKVEEVLEAVDLLIDREIKTIGAEGLLKLFKVYEERR
jgi:ADP-heptose:LPS heptosyltransferase